MGIKELSAGLISPLCHPALYSGGTVASAGPDLQWGLHIDAHRKAETGVALLYMCAICLSLTAGQACERAQAWTGHSLLCS
ncbi:hypothetical protein KUCAC02_007821 [Chaenocephalus aceratus]|uniref:Uncharacterized protein n=1 Tax=Chaenocephalus aceratus TaxID=36190 RepID=A0ACB9X796_CHAAC|nr:hypothetical protein KUCAC02_007821 [Chaenocephalus aceratus]